ncbi:hypothetical protein L7F22_045042 [Adiantum nelumboides]|nr:hypothetical protein [Adiantum nelumboides]
MMHGKLCVTKQLRPKVLIECHAPRYAGHRGIDVTVKAVHKFFLLPTLRRDVDQSNMGRVLSSGDGIPGTGLRGQKAPGLLQPLPIPDKPWESIAMDFIFYLPRTPTGNDGIWSKQAHFAPVRKKIKSDHMVKLFMHNIFKYHGMPQSIVSNRDPRMTSLFWKALFENMGTTLKFSSSFHPQTDGQSEEANSTILDLLKCYVSEHKATWEHYLPLVEYVYNNTVHTSTGKAPFEIVEGGKKVPPFLQTKGKIFEATKDMVPEEQLEVEELDEILVPEQILAHKDRKARGKVARRYLVKFKNYSPMDAKWMEEAELVDSPQLLQLISAAVGLPDIYVRTPNFNEMYTCYSMARDAISGSMYKDFQHAQGEAAASLLNIPGQNSEKNGGRSDNMRSLSELNAIVTKYSKVQYCSLDSEKDPSSNSFTVHGADGKTLAFAEKKFMHAIIVRACHGRLFDVVAELSTLQNESSKEQQEDLQNTKQASGFCLVAKKVDVIQYGTHMSTICKDLEKSLAKPDW